MLERDSKPIQLRTQDLNGDLEPAKKVLRKFLAEIEEVKAFRKNISQPQLATSFSIKDRMPVFDASEFNPSRS